MPPKSYSDQFQRPVVLGGDDSTSQAIIRDPDCVSVLEKKTVDPLAECGRTILGGLGVTGGGLFAISGENLGYVIIILSAYFAGSGVWRLRKYFGNR